MRLYTSYTFNNVNLWGFLFAFFLSYSLQKRGNEAPVMAQLFVDCIKVITGTFVDAQQH